MKKVIGMIMLATVAVMMVDASPPNSSVIVENDFTCALDHPDPGNVIVIKNFYSTGSVNITCNPVTTGSSNTISPTMSQDATATPAMLHESFIFSGGFFLGKTARYLRRHPGEQKLYSGLS